MPGHQLLTQRRWFCGGDDLGGDQDILALRHHGHGCDMGKGSVRALPVRPRVFLGGRRQHAGDGLAHPLCPHVAGRVGHPD